MNTFFKNELLCKKYSAILVYIAIALLAISDSGIQLLILTEIGPGSRTLRLTALWLLLAKALLTRYTKKEFLWIAPISLLALYNYTISGNIYCIYTILIIACMKDVDYTILFKTLFYSTLSAIVFVGILSAFGIGSPTKIIEDFGRGMVETRYCFGLHHPNIWHQAIGRCMIFGCIAYYKRLNILPLIFLLALNCFIYTLSVSRTGLIAISVFLMLMLLYKGFKKLMHKFCVKLCILMSLPCVYGTYLYFAYKLTGDYNLSAELFNWKFTTGRLRQAVDFLSAHPVRFFSSRFPDDGTLFDCGFMRLFYQCGYLWAGLFFAALIALLLLAMKHRWDIIIPTAFYFIFCSLYEFSPVTRPTYNMIVFFFPLLIFTNAEDSFQRLMTSSRKTENPVSLLSSSTR